MINPTHQRGIRKTGRSRIRPIPPPKRWEKGKRKGAHECALPDGEPPYPFSSNPSFFSSSLVQWARPAALAES